MGQLSWKTGTPKLPILMEGLIPPFSKFNGSFVFTLYTSFYCKCPPYRERKFSSADELFLSGKCFQYFAFYILHGIKLIADHKMILSKRVVKPSRGSRVLQRLCG